MSTAGPATRGAQFAELPLADYLRMARVFVSLGITKIRLTGGEPLLRRDIVELVRELAALRTVAGTPPELAITTNGHLLAEMAEPLKQAGLDRVTVSMDAVDPERFARITRVQNGYAAVLEGLRAARRAGLGPVKVNCVLLRGFNEDQIEAFGALRPAGAGRGALHRIHAARRGPRLDAGGGGAAGGSSGAHGALCALP